MAKINSHQLHYAFDRILTRRLRSLKVNRVKDVVDDLVPTLMEEVPTEAFDGREPYDEGVLFFHSDVDEAECVNIQHCLAYTHINLPKSKPIQINLSSPGGSMDAGFAVISTIQEIQRDGRKVNIHIQGIAMSMGSIIAQAGNTRTIEAHGAMMLHEPSWSYEAKIKDHADYVEFTQRYWKLCLKFYAERSGRSVEYFEKRMARKDWYLTADEALEEGLVDAVKPAPSYRRQRTKKPLSSTKA